MSETTELDRLVAALAEGDRSVFPSAFRLLWPPIYRLCRSMLHHDADAEDAAQQALEKIFARCTDYDPTRPALPWALAIASWECRTLRQKRLRRREQGDLGEQELIGPNAEQVHVERQLLDAALAAMGTLSESDRETLLATFWEEAASVSGATLRKRRERALARLRDTFRRLYGLD